MKERQPFLFIYFLFFSIFPESTTDFFSFRFSYRLKLTLYSFSLFLLFIYSPQWKPDLTQIIFLFLWSLCSERQRKTKKRKEIEKEKRAKERKTERKDTLSSAFSLSGSLAFYLFSFSFFPKGTGSFTSRSYLFSLFFGVCADRNKRKRMRKDRFFPLPFLFSHFLFLCLFSSLFFISFLSHL